MFPESSASSEGSEEGGCSPLVGRIKLALYLNTFFSAVLWSLTGFNLIQPVFLPLFVERHGGTPFQFSLVPITWCLATFPSIGLSYLIQRQRGRKWPATLSFLVAALVAFAAAWCEHLPLQPASKIWLILGLTVVGHALMNYYLIAYLPWMGRLIPAAEMAGFQSRRVLLFWTAKPLSELAAGYTLQSMPSLGFPVLYVVSGLCALAAAAVMLTVPDVHIVSAPRRFREEVAGAVRDASLRRFLTVLAVVHAAWLLSGVFPTIFMKRELALEYNRIGLYAFLASAGALVMVLGWGRVLDLFGARVVMQFAVIGMATMPILWLLNTRGHAYFVPLAQLSTGVFNAAFGVAVLPLLYRITPHERQGIALALWYSVVGAVGIVSPLLGGEIVARLKPFHFTVGSYEFGSLHYLFAAQLVACVAAIPFVRRIREPEARSFRLAVGVLRRKPLRAVAAFLVGERFVNGRRARDAAERSDPAPSGASASLRRDPANASQPPSSTAASTAGRPAALAAARSYQD